MTIDVTNFKFANNAWEGTVQSPNPTTIWLKGDADLLNDARNVQRLESLARGMETHVDLAVDYATASEYASDIADANGLVLDSIYVESWDDIRIWFSLANNSGRMLGVQVVRSKPSSVFCDS